MSGVVEAASIIRRCVCLDGHIKNLALQPGKSEGEREAVARLLREGADVMSEVMQRRDDVRLLLRLEQDRLRPLAVDVRTYGLRHHLTFARPLWGARATTRPNCFSVFGEPDVVAATRQPAKLLHLELLEEQPGRAADRSRWEMVTSANFALFDLRTAASRAGSWPSTCHGLGMALSVGTYPILLADYQAALPFDIHLKPLTVGAERVLEEVLGEAMAEAATGIPPASDSASSVEPTVRHILAEVSADDPTVRYLRPHIERLRTGRPDAVTTRLYLESLLSLIPLRDGVLLTPAWPGAYPDHHAPSCFHILPFALSSQVSSAVEAGCRGRARYVRGDTTGSTDVIDGIWDSIAKASAVIADLTPAPARQGDSAVPSRLPNANVCLELAFAQVLGRRLLLVHDEREPFPELFPQIAKLQARPYRSTAQLTDMTASFVTQAVTRA